MFLLIVSYVYSQLLLILHLLRLPISRKILNLLHNIGISEFFYISDAKAMEQILEENSLNESYAGKEVLTSPVSRRSIDSVLSPEIAMTPRANSTIFESPPSISRGNNSSLASSRTLYQSFSCKYHLWSGWC